MTLRQPIVTFVGHVDHGKTSLQDFIRQSSVVHGEAGKITQHIGASNIPLETIRKICGDLLDALKLNLTIPGLLFIDTPGHAAFTNMRKRGGNLADMAILVIDINEGVMPQTIECIEILKQYKTPFIIALNKIDLLHGWQSKQIPLLTSLKQQSETVQHKIEERLYQIVGKLSDLGLNSERFDRIEDYTQQIAIVPASAKSGEGVPELLMVLVGLAQKYMEQKLNVNCEGFAKGTVLEIKEEKGIGTTVDVILYDGCLNQNDCIVVGTLEEPIVSKVRALLEPVALADMRDKKTRFQNVTKVISASGVKISAPDLDKVVAGMPIRSCAKADIELVKQEIKKEIEEVLIETDDEGIVVKADSLGSLEALLKLLKEKNIPVKKASIGNINKKDIVDAEANLGKNKLAAVILGFNVSINEQSSKIRIFTHDVIYRLIEDLQQWQAQEKKRMEGNQLDFVIRPVKLQIMKGYVFRQNNPAVVGVDILFGTLKVDTPLMKNNGEQITEVKAMQAEQKGIEKAEKGKQVAISLPGVTVGRQLHEGDILYSAVPEEDFRKMKELRIHLSEEEKNLLKEIASIMREKNPVWGV